MSKRVAGAMCLAVAVVAAGCGSANGSAGTKVAVTGAQVYAATVKATSADVSVVLSEASRSGPVLKVTTSGAFSWQKDQGEMEMKVAMGGALQKSDTSESEIVLGRDTYTKVSLKDFPASVKGLPPLNGWQESTETGKASAQGPGLLALLLGGGVAPSSGDSPASMLQLLRAEASSRRDLGHQVLDGVATTHYQVVVPVDRLVGANGSQAAEAQKTIGSKTVTFDYWTDSSLRLRQLDFAMTIRHLGVSESPSTAPPTTTMSSTASSASHSVTMIGHGSASGVLFKAPLTFSVVLRISDYGVPVNVHAPPASKVTSHSTCQATGTSINCQS